MINTEQIFAVRPFRWKWVGVSFCLFVSFHLLPAYITGTFSAVTFMNPWVDPGWMVWIFLGIGMVGTFIGYKSRGITVFEPAVASLMYVVVLAFTLPRFWSPALGTKQAAILLLAFIGAFVVSVAGSAFGEILQQRKENRARKNNLS
jgi:hypothetical protein